MTQTLSPASARADALERLLDWLLLVTLFALTWEKIRWEAPAFSLTISNLLSVAFVLAFATHRLQARDAFVHRTVLVLAGFGLAFLAVYLAGYFDLRNREALAFWLKGLATWCVHFLFLLCALAHLTRRGRALFERAIRWFVGGLVVNCAYGLLQLALQVAVGVNLDQVVIARLTSGQGGVGGIEIFGTVEGAKSIYRINALTGDPNHLGVMLCVPLLLLLPRYLAGCDRTLGLLLLFMLGSQALTLSRSAALGDVVGLLVLAPALRRYVSRARTLLVAAAALGLALVALYASSPYLRSVVQARTQLSGRGTQTHFQFYELVPPALDPHPLFGMGYNTFAVFYEFVTGRSDFGPHSVWVAILVETGAVGFVVYLAYFAYLLASALAVARAPAPATSRLGYGLLAALLGTAAANLFYLTMSFDYFFALVVFAVGAGALAVRAGERAPAPLRPGFAPGLPR